MASYPTYFAVIPAEVRYDRRLKAEAKLLYGEISSLCNCRGYCTVSNAYFAKLYNTTPRTVAGWVRELLDAGFVFCDTKWTIEEDEPQQLRITRTEVSFREPLEKPKKRQGLQESKEPEITAKEVADLFNELCPSYPQLKSISEYMKRTIKARVKSGYKRGDFETLFRKAELSPFLRGKNSSSWSASFDWLIKDANMAKVLNGNYDEKGLGDDGNESYDPFLDIAREFREKEAEKNNIVDFQ